MEATKRDTKEEKGIVAYRSRDGQEIRLNFETVKRFLVSGHPELVTEQEMMLYMGICKARGLNPFKKDCYLVKYTPNDPAATIVSIDYYRARARAQDDCCGWECGIIVQTSDHSMEYRKGAIIIDEEKLIGGWFRARPKGWDVDLEWTVPLKRYIKTTKEGKVTRFWQEDNQPEQIAKVAESQGLRRAWPDEFAKLYIKEEIVEGVAIDSEPLKMPQAIDSPAQAKADPVVEGARQPLGETKESHEENDRRNDRRTDRGVLGGTSPGVDSTHQSKKTPEDRKAAALTFIEESTDEEWTGRPKDWLEKAIKGLKQADQLEIARKHNERNRAIKAAEGAPSV